MQFSVITPSFNQGLFIEGCIQSVLQQGVEGFEHIVVDNCSSDDTTRIVRKYPHVTWISEPDKGQSHALNKGFRMARGDIVCWLNSDDQYRPGALARIREAFAAHPTGVIFGDALVRDTTTGTERVAHARFSNRSDFLCWWEGKVKLYQPAIFFRREVFDRVGYLREDLHLIMDYEFWWRLSEFYEFRKLDQVLCVQQVHPEAKTAAQALAVYEERQRVFSPQFRALSETSPMRAMARERRGAASLFLRHADYFCRQHKRAQSWTWLGAAFRMNPFVLFSRRFIGASLCAMGIR